MSPSLFRASALVALLAVAGCNASLEDIAPKSERALSSKMTELVLAKGMQKTSPIMLRVFKEENVLEVWKQKSNGRYDLVTSYNICKWSGKLGPKFTEGDRQAPEGFYSVTPAQMNPNSNYYLAFNTGYPNAYDRAHGRTGSHLMVHGACSSSGCYSLTDAQIQEVYAFARDAFAGGQQAFQFQAFPFRMTAANMARYKDDPNFEFWKMLKEGYDHFEITKVPPKVDVCEKRYVFNRFPEGEASFASTAACPPATMPDTLATAYQSHQSKETQAFSAALSKASPPPKASILGIKEASLVADWSKKRSRGERVPLEPPSMQKDGRVVATSTMGRIDSPLGRKMAALEAAEAAKKRAAEEKKLAAERAKAEAEAKRIALEEAKKAPKPEEKAEAKIEQAAADPDTAVTAVRKRIRNLFGG
ncbi:MAG: murein L,D-transpeptidase [Mesorhizobium sp.]|nr:murein L,D-transpeptidase family protein [Mesorhizobium sp.]MCO5162183.1 murein L,D-transpeptidase [Mesorhizobium sp.]